MKTNDEVRRLNLLEAIRQAGSAAKLARLIGTAPAYLSQIKSKTPDSKTGVPKAMGDEMARRIESALQQPIGWMDASHDNEAKPGEVAEAHRKPAETIHRGEAVIAHMILATPSEIDLLEAFRLADEFELKIFRTTTDGVLSRRAGRFRNKGKGGRGGDNGTLG